jgi:hypothetical protein
MGFCGHVFGHGFVEEFTKVYRFNACLNPFSLFKMFKPCLNQTKKQLQFNVTA